MEYSTKIDTDYKEGKKVEGLFKKIMTEMGFKWIAANKSQDRREGWDIYIIHSPPFYGQMNNRRIDVKGIKGVKYNWVEFIGYDSYKNQKLGWLLGGDGDTICFEYENYWLLVDKATLKDFVLEKIPLLKKMETLSKNNDDLFNMILSDINKFDIRDNKNDSLYDIMYTRKNLYGSPDLTTRVLTSDLLNMTLYKINKWNKK